MTNTDAMYLAINLAMRGAGFVSPNPLVGAVILKDGKIIGTGYHHKFGDIHAETDAINNFKGIDLRETTLVLNLEPCSHQGKQPPCANLIIETNITNVVIGMQDPNPLVSGRGISILKEAGIEVTTGVLEEECKWLNRFFIKHITTGMPYIIAKTAQSLNGSIAFQDGTSKWISSVESRKIVHKLRAETDAVAVGKNTILVDDPELTVRLVDGRNPYRIIFDTNLELPLSMKVFSDINRDKTIVVCSAELKKSEKAKLMTGLDINLIFAGKPDGRYFDMPAVFRELYSKFGIGSVLVEGGSSLHNSLYSQEMIDELLVFIAPRIISNGKPSFWGSYESKPGQSESKYKIIKNEMSGGDMLLTLVRNG